MLKYVYCINLCLFQITVSKCIILKFINLYIIELYETAWFEFTNEEYIIFAVRDKSNHTLIFIY